MCWVAVGCNFTILDSGLGAVMPIRCVPQLLRSGGWHFGRLGNGSSDVCKAMHVKTWWHSRGNIKETEILMMSC
jgi:hypothetical protein